jgi:hypothetical protein
VKGPVAFAGNVVSGVFAAGGAALGSQFPAIQSGDKRCEIESMSADVAERSSNQQQSGQQESVSFDNPLHVDDCCVQTGLEGG